MHSQETNLLNSNFKIRVSAKSKVSKQDIMAIWKIALNIGRDLSSVHNTQTVTL